MAGRMPAGTQALRRPEGRYQTIVPFCGIKYAVRCCTGYFVTISSPTYFFLKSRLYAVVWLRAQPGGGNCGKMSLSCHWWDHEGHEHGRTADRPSRSQAGKHAGGEDGQYRAGSGNAPALSPNGEMAGPRGSGGGLAGLRAGSSPFFPQRATGPFLRLPGLGRAALAAGGLAAAQCRGLPAGAGRGVGHDDAGPGPLASATGPGLAEDGLHTGCGGRADPAGRRSPAQSRLPQGRGSRPPCPGTGLPAGLGPAVAAGRAAA